MKGRRPVLSFVLMWAVFLGGTALGFGQITITSDEIPAEVGYLNAYIVETGASLPVELGPVGGPQVWDFTTSQTAVDTTYVSVDRIVSGDETPFTAEFPQANIVRRIEGASLAGFSSSGGYQFEKIDAQDYGLLGFGLSGLPGILDKPFVAELDSPLTILSLPLAYGSTWSDTSNFVDTLEIVYQGTKVPIRIDVDYSRKAVVDGWGTMVIPQGEYNALRVRYHDGTSIDVDAKYFFWFPVFDTTITTYSHNWFAEEIGSIAGVTSRGNETDSLFTRAASIRRLTVWTGDVNGDHFINVEDVMETVNHILGIGILPDEAAERADCDGDGQIDLFDALGIIRTSLGLGQCEPVLLNSYAFSEKATPPYDATTQQTDNGLAQLLFTVEDQIFRHTGSRISIDVQSLMDHIMDKMRTMK